MKGYLLTRIPRVTPMVTSDKPSDMNDINATPENASASADGNPGGWNEPEGRSARPLEPSLGGKDHTMSPAGTLDAGIFVEDGSKTPRPNLPGTSEVVISEQFKPTYRPETLADGLLESRLGNSPTGVGISHQWMEAKR